MSRPRNLEVRPATKPCSICKIQPRRSPTDSYCAPCRRAKYPVVHRREYQRDCSLRKLADVYRPKRQEAE